MKILMPRLWAIGLLQTRLSDVEIMTLDNYKAIVSRVIIDIKDIFATDDQLNEIVGVNFQSPYPGISLFDDGKRELVNYLNIYIEYLSDLPDESIDTQGDLIELQNQFNLIKVDNDNRKNQIEQYEMLVNELKYEIRSRQVRIDELDGNVFQTESLNAKKLWQLWVNLPGGLQRATFGIVAAIFAIGIFVGHFLYKIGVL